MYKHFIFEDEEEGYFAVCAQDEEEAIKIAQINFDSPILIDEATDEKIENFGLDEF